MNTERTTAVVLRRTNYGEADRILQLLTPNGQRSVMARGVRKEKSRLAGGIELFATSDVVITKGKGGLGILTSARMRHFYRHILDDYDRMQFAYEVTELAAKASESVDEAHWYDILVEVYAGLDATTVPLQLIQVWFYLQYAEVTGYGLNLERDINGEPLEAAQRYMYDMSERGLRRAENGDITAACIKLLRIINAKSIGVVAQIGGVETVLADCWLIARQHAAV